MREYFVYMLRCSDDSFYIGVTGYLELRLAEHHSGFHPTSYTYSRRPVQCVHVETFNEVLDAIAREKQLKRWSRKKKAALVIGEWEVLPALAESQYAKRIHSIRVMVRRAHHDTFGIDN
jgi:putative endonuclease